MLFSLKKQVLKLVLLVILNDFFKNKTFKMSLVSIYIVHDCSYISHQLHNFYEL